MLSPGAHGVRRSSPRSGSSRPGTRAGPTGPGSRPGTSWPRWCSRAGWRCWWAPRREEATGGSKPFCSPFGCGEFKKPEFQYGLPWQVATWVPTPAVCPSDRLILSHRLVHWPTDLDFDPSLGHGREQSSERKIQLPCSIARRFSFLEISHWIPPKNGCCWEPCCKFLR